MIQGAMGGAAFDRYIETQLAPMLRPSDIVILGNLSVHKSARARAILRALGVRLLFLPQECSNYFEAAGYARY